MRRRNILWLALVPAVAAAQEQVITFANGRVEVVLPASFRIVSNGAETLVAVFGGTAEDHKLELTLHDQLDSSPVENSAEQFVREQAQKKGRRTREVPGKVLFLDPGADFMHDGKPYKAIHLQVGFGRSLVVVTVTAPFSEPVSPAMSEFLAKPVNVMLASLRRR
jgi:hypothetical protein